MSDILKDFDKKNEVTKVKIPKFATGGICNDAIFPKLDVFSQIDEIVKDIAKRKDNAMAMEFTKCIGELLRNNGVVPKISEYRMENHTENKIEMRYGVTIDELDFSEHDRVFENEIAVLKSKIAIKDMDYKTASELLGKYQQENEGLKQRIAELESELEKKECIKTMRIEFHADNGEMLTPLEVANSLINQNTFKVDELRELSEFLQVYCNHHEDRDIEPSIMLF